LVVELNKGKIHHRVIFGKNLSNDIMSEFFSKTSCAQVAYLGPILYDLHFRFT